MIRYGNIIDDKDPRIREKSEEVPLPLSAEDRAMLEEMLEYLEASQAVSDDEENEDLRPGVGMAAIQLGIPKKICAVLIYETDEDQNVTGETRYGLVNPKIVSHSEKLCYLKAGEGCLSVREEHEGYVPRYQKVTVTAYDALQDCEVTIVARGYHAIVLQHELDHFSGTLFYDHINPEDPFAEIPNAAEIE